MTPNDRGVYRFSGLPPGKYRISVRVIEWLPVAENIKPRGFSDLTVFAPDTLSEAGSKVVQGCRKVSYLM